jgi:sugar phosphate isomerase/epimerase
MKNIIISNIAWERQEEIGVFDILKKMSIKQIEIAITKYFQTWDIDKSDILSLKEYFQKNNISIYSFQSIMYGLNYNLFDNNDLFIKHIEKIIEFAKILNTKKIIFGSPKNRIISGNYEQKIDIFLNSMKKINNMCSGHDISFCIEPNSKVYGCNFIINSKELLGLLILLNEKNIKMHLDTACMHLEDDKPSNIENYKDFLDHFHISEPYLGNMNGPIIRHNDFSFFLKKINYDKYLSIEMKSGENNVDTIKNAINFVRETYSY